MIGLSPVFATPRALIQCSIVLLVLVLAACAVWPWTFDPNLAPPGMALLTYIYTLILLVGFFGGLAGRGAIVLSEPFLLAPLVLAAIGLASLVHSWLSPGLNTYSSALIPLLLCALPLVVPPEDLYVNGEGMARFVLFLLGLASIWHLIGQIGETAGFRVVPGHEETLSFCFLILFAGFSKRRRLLISALAAAAVSLAMRPSSTLLVGVLAGCALIWVRRMGWNRQMRIAAVSIIVLTLVLNLLILHSPSFANLVYSVEPYLKQDLLAGHTNNEFRLGVIEALREETVSNSILFGKFFIGNILPYVSSQLPWWYGASGTDYAPVHSDFLLVLSQGGLVGYSIFAVFLIGFARCCMAGAALSDETRREQLSGFFDASLAAEAVFCFYISFNPMMQKVYIVGQFFVLVPICVFLLRELRRTVFYPSTALALPPPMGGKPALHA